MTNQKTVVNIYDPGSHHWVGNGFPVRNLFPSNPIQHLVDPFLLLDYAGPMEFPPSDGRRGVGEHPHRGFETVTIVYQGVVEHRDSGGNQGRLNAGDVQWMTAASGVVHEEFHGKEFAAQGGALEMVQLWVNLPKSHKMDPPRYQDIEKERIPVVDLGGGNQLRVIAGNYQGHSGAAKTVTPLNLFDLTLQKGFSEGLELTPAFNAGVFLLSGQIEIGGTVTLQEAQFAVLSPQESKLVLSASQESRLLILNGQPLREPIASQGPFVMNTREEILQAIQDYQTGKMGHLGPNS